MYIHPPPPPPTKTRRNKRASDLSSWCQAVAPAVPPMPPRYNVEDPRLFVFPPVACWSALATNQHCFRWVARGRVAFSVCLRGYQVFILGG